MNARLLAQEVSKYYIQHLDVYETHSNNIKGILRKLILSLTIKILYPNEVVEGETLLEGCLELEEENDTNHHSNNDDGTETQANGQQQQDWRQYLRRVDSSDTAFVEDETTIKWNKQDQDTYDNKLGRRTRARMDAFIDGCIYALPGGEDEDENENTTENKAAAKKQSFFRNNSSSSNNNSNKKKTSKKKTKKKTKSLQPATATSTNGTTVNAMNGMSNHDDSGLPSLTEALSGFNVQSLDGRPSQTTTTAEENKKHNDNNAKAVTAVANPTTTSTKPGDNNNKKKYKKKIQFTSVNDNYQLAVRVELYIRTLNRVKSLKKECVICEEPNRAMNARVQQIVTTFVEEVGCVSLVTPVLTKLVATLTKELLAVSVLSENIQKIIQRFVIDDYIHQTSFGSLAFLSTPDIAADTKLTPILLSYINKYLKQSCDLLVQECEVEYFLSSILDSKMRYYFKNIEFQSIGHLLDVCSSDEIRHELHNIQLSPNVGGLITSEGTTIDTLCSDTKVIKQAIRDLQREVITVNGHVLPPAQSRKDLVNLLSQMLNTTPPASSSSSKRSKGNNTKRISTKTKTTSGKGGDDKYKQRESSPSVMHSPSSKMNYSSGTDSDILSGTDSDILSSGNEGDNSPISNRKLKFNNKNEDISSRDAQQAFVDNNSNSSRRRGGRQRRSSISMKTVDMLTRRLLLATSRTGMGGDAYFVVKDLFGGDDVEVVPSSQQQQQYQQESHYNPPLPSPYGEFEPSPPPSPFYSSSSRIMNVGGNGGAYYVGGGRSSIEIIVRLATVTIKCHGSFDVYPKPIINDCREPLIQIHTTTSETITLHEVRACDCIDNNNNNITTTTVTTRTTTKSTTASAKEGSVGKEKVTTTTGVKSHIDSNNNGGNKNNNSNQQEEGSALILQEKQTDKTGWRTLSVRPALYEVVEVFNTPS